MSNQPYIPCFVHRKSYHQRRKSRISALAIYFFILLLINILPFGLDSFAQKGYMFGLQISPNMSMGSISHLSKPSADFSIRPNIGVGGGFVFHYGFKYGYYKNISLRSGLLLTYKRYNISLKDDYVNFQRQVFDIPVEIPLLISVRTILSEHTYLRQYVGLSLNYVRQFADEYAGEGTGTNEFYSVDYSLSYNSRVINGITSNFIAGVAYEMEGYKGHLYDVGISYHRGIRPEMVGRLNYSLKNLENNFSNSYSHELISNGSFLALNLSIYLCEPKECWMCWFW